MLILALEFSSPCRSVALLERENARGGSKVLGTVSDRGSRGDSAFALVETVLKEAHRGREGVEEIVVGLGPGSYTGIRSSIAMAQGWQLARSVRLQGISSAECLAAAAQSHGLFGSVRIAIDAQRQEVYLARYELGPDRRQLVEALHLVPVERLKAEDEGAGSVLVGPEVDRWSGEGRVLFPDAATLGGLATLETDSVPGEKLEPIYLRETTFVKARIPPPRPPLPTASS